MTAKHQFLAGFAVLLIGAVAACGEMKGIHIPPGRNVGWNWSVDDGAGFRWDISSQGVVNDGTGDAYDGGMQLQINGAGFSYSSSGRLSEDGREVETGPWTTGALRVYRRIYVDPKLGYCRWIDIFENTSGTAQTVSLRYYSNLGGSVRLTHTTSGAARVTDKDWGIVTAYDAGQSSRPAIAHIFATPGAKRKPDLKYVSNNDNLYYNMTLKVPARKGVALCFFEAQRRPYAKAREFLKEFKPTGELRKVPTPLRRIIVNMGGAMLSLGSLELLRDDRFDMAVLQNGDELLGTILNDRFVLDTFYGELDLPAKRVVGLSVPAADDPCVLVALSDGQIVAGRMLNAPLVLRLANGNDISLPTPKVKTASFRLSPDRPERIRPSLPLAVLRSRQQLFFDATDLRWSFHSECGRVELDPVNLRAVEFDTPGGGLHRVIFRNGTVLSGLMDASELKLGLKLGHVLDIARHAVKRIVFPAGSADPPGDETLAELTLRNGNVLRGRIVQKSLNVRTRYGKVTIRPDNLARMDFQPNALGAVQIKLHSGTTVRGELAAGTIRFHIDPGPELPVFIGHIANIVYPKAEGAPAGRDAEATARPAAGTRAAHPTTLAKAELAVSVRQRKAVLDLLEAKKTKLAAAGGAESVKELARTMAQIAKTKAEIAKLTKQLASP